MIRTADFCPLVGRIVQIDRTDFVVTIRQFTREVVYLSVNQSATRRITAIAGTKSLQQVVSLVVDAITHRKGSLVNRGNR